MRTLHYLIAAVFLWGIYGTVSGVSVTRPAGVDKALRDLAAIVVQVEKNRTDETQTQMDIETRLLGSDGRAQMDNRLGMDSEALTNYMEEGQDDIAYLRANWKYLTASERSGVDNAEEEIRE